MFSVVSSHVQSLDPTTNVMQCNATMFLDVVLNPTVRRDLNLYSDLKARSKGTAYDLRSEL